MAKRKPTYGLNIVPGVASASPRRQERSVRLVVQSCIAARIASAGIGAIRRGGKPKKGRSSASADADQSKVRADAEVALRSLK